MPKQYSGEQGEKNDGRVEKALRVLTLIMDKGHAPAGTGGTAGTQTVLSRQTLAGMAGVTVRNLDSIISSLRRQGFEIKNSDAAGYYLEDPYNLKVPRVRTPAHYNGLQSLRRFIAQHPGAIEQQDWLNLIDTILASSESARQLQMGRSFRDAKVDDEGVMYKVDEPMIFYLNVHRANPDQITRAHLLRLTRAIAVCQPVRMTYVNRQGEKDLIVVEPYFIFQREGTYYLAGIQTENRAGKLKTALFKPFVISRARCPSLDILPDRFFKRNPAFEPELSLTITGIRNQDPSEQITAEIDIFGRFAYSACEMIHGETSEARWIDRADGEQQLHLRATFGSRYDMVRFVLAYGENAELHLPADVREMIRANIIGMARRYGLQAADFMELEAGK